MKYPIDLHMHSTCSDDGEFTPIQLVQACKAAEIRVMSITDHNSARANAEAKQEAAKLGIRYISGIEMDCRFGEKDLHMLGYGIDETSPDFAEMEAYLFAEEQQASVARLALTRTLGFEVSEAELNAISNLADGTGLWSGEVFGEVLLAKPEYHDHALLRPYRPGGERDDNPFVNFYWDYYAQGRPCYVKVAFPALEEAIEIIHKNGGKAVLAHPGNNLKGQFELFDDIAKTGIDGVEVFCSYHDEKTAQYFYEQAQKHGLIMTCGSDYHGKIKPAVILGGSGCWVDPQDMEHQLGLSS
ncbi:MAG: PHP domain-containing protein [Oscillospiraceae bacterium]|nr:PHP domain-containing protein [Oscillospiraceae bacterium]